MARYSKAEAQAWAWENLRGQWTTLITPFTPDDRVDEAALRHNIRHIRQLGVRGAGSTWGMGEFWSLTREERIRIQEIVADEARAGTREAGGWPIAAHVTHTCAQDMVALAKHAESVGYDLLIVAAPYIVTKMEEQVIEFVRLLAANTQLAIMFYNSPQFGIVMSPPGLKRLCQIPNVVGVKEASFNRQISIETHLLAGKDAIISTPDEWIFDKAKELGFQQQVMFANTSDWRFDTPGANHYVQFIEKATSGNLDKRFYEDHLRDIKQLSDKWWGRIVTKSGGVLPASLCKYWGELMGLRCGHVRPPLVGLTPEEKEELRQELSALRPIAGETATTREKDGGPLPHGAQSDALTSRVYVTSLTPRAEGSAKPAGAGNGRPGWLPNPGNMSGMMLMVSAQNLEEALEAEKGGADIVDIKNLQEAMVGSGHPMLAREVRARIPAEKHVSVTLGVVPNQPGTVAMAVYAAAQLQASSVKVGFVRAEYDTALQVLREARDALEGSDCKLIGSLFADNHLYDGLDPHLVVKLCRDGYCDGLLIDTLTKDGRNLFDFMSEAELREVVIQGKMAGMSTALSGHLQIDDLDELARINPDIVGVRGAVCSTGDRNRSIAWEAVARFKRELDRRISGEIDVRAGGKVGNGKANGANGSGDGWVIVDGRGKNCAGVLAALSRQIESAPQSFVEALVGDALNIHDVMEWAERGGHHLLTRRQDPDGTVRLLIQPGRAQALV
jgi:(5-formylfuran-3-yl)methyl phosphate synthase